MNATLRSLREQGIQALREGNLDQAIDQLSRALIADTQDAEAQMFLGVAYSQKGLHAQAKRALLTAVELRPQEGRWYFNLGVALEQAGDTAGAVDAYRHAVRIDPEQTQARVRLQGLNASVDVPRGAASHPAGRASGASTWSPPSSAGRLAMEAPSPARPAGAIECGRCRQWSKPGLSCEWCSAPLQPAPAPSTAPWLAPGYGADPVGSASDSALASPVIEMTARDAFNRRWLANVIDSLVCYALGFLAGLAIGLIMGVGAALTGGYQDHSAIAALGRMLGGLSGMALGYTYYVGMLCARGQTLGKMAMGLRVVGPEGAKPTFRQAAIRETIGKLISTVCALFGYLWMLWDGEQQTWHDKIAGTYVVRA